MLKIAGPPAPDTLTPNQFERRQRIVRAALRALINSDYERVKISEVARESGVALGTVYRYFASKEHLFAAAFVEWQTALKVKLEKSAPLGDSEADRLRDVFRRVIRSFQLQPQFFGVMIMMQNTTDPYAADIYQSIGDVFHDTVQSAFDGPFDEDRMAIYHTVNAVLTMGLSGWSMKRLTIKDVYTQVDQTIGLIYEFRPEQ
jgi:AcrR family transcriptional regulator